MLSETHSDLSAWGRSVDEVLDALSVDPLRGLDAGEVLTRRQDHGLNQLEAKRRRHVFSILAGQFRSIVVALLVGACVLAFLFSDYAEGLAILAVIVINSLIGFLTEWRAVRSMEALREFVRVECVVLREGAIRRLPASQLVPGDIVLFEAGDLVSADMRLIESAKLTADESTLTGESLPVHKHTDPLDDETPVLERHNMVFSGTSVTRGSGKGVVTGTGKNTEFGKIFEEVIEAEPQQTPLEKRLNALGARLAWAVIVIAVVVAVAGIAVGREIFLSIEVAIALSVAAIPEGLAIVATIALARGMWRMAKRNALITRLSAVETLGATSVILTDKTGTLTENRMAVSTVFLAECDVTVEGGHEPGRAQFGTDDGAIDDDCAAVLDELLQTATLCSNASLRVSDEGETGAVGDPTELALLVAASGRGIWRHELLETIPEVHEDPFDPDSKRMATVHRQSDGFLVAVKGAPEAVIPACMAVRNRDGVTPLGDADRQRWLGRVEHLGQLGLRTIAIANKVVNDAGAEPYSELTLVGVVGLEDPAREGVEQAVRRCRQAGISIVMVTGDHVSTAHNIAATVGVVDDSATERDALSGPEVDVLLAGGDDEKLLATSIFARVTPEQKLRLIDLYQKNGHVVAMTGDGVNDAPALKKADIGVAMGIRGTAVAKEAAAMILQDDELNTIVAAVAHGRAIFQNIRKFVLYLLSCNTSEVLVVSLATIAGAPLPLLPLQILFLNLVTDVFPALALGVGKGAPSLMTAKPRPSGERILMPSHWRAVALHGAIMAITVLAAMAFAIYVLEFDRRQAVTVSFCTLALAQMWHVFNMRDDIRRILDNEITRNAWVWGALALCLVLVLAAVYAPGLSEVLVLTGPGWAGWGVIVTASLVPLLAAPIVRHFS